MRIAAIHAFTGTPGGIQLRDLSVLGSEPVILQNQMLTPEIAVAVALTLLIDPACKISDEALRTVTETLVPVIISEAQQRTVLCYIRSLRRQLVDPEDNGAQGLYIAHRALIATGIGAGVALVLLGVWYAADLLLLVFAGVLVSILLRGFSRLFARATGVGHGLSLALVSLTRLALLAGVVRLIGGSIGSQLNKLQQQLPQAVESLNRFVARYEWAHSAIESLPSVNEWLAGRRSTIVWVTVQGVYNPLILEGLSGGKLVIFNCRLEQAIDFIAILRGTPLNSYSSGASRGWRRRRSVWS